ncbi:shikimate dehydrogenase [Tenacibaculum finnmarkense genomovar finnmarkense]|uniref:shikimate dehydrogenase family protein n=1 Tax=Tenacibaculum finnmarkense TaxID=2781243 RepID=UPI001E54BE21|nr:shikimate dehydrogenase [Tenacibaculum finnmarkense]MCD8417378.1 shikimate dehydrogenase [Tenacibaculum finnmarkense genomovar finnmarkense]MCG8185727.1 shikimate dehydrogenase [Tenacibaculum finnmarkense genomovar finnmarkense]MCG8202280.1 shikimate dehydrogenase [Tenacibaculum finnmarkense genomovar finnmarkense]MCG8209716.1 shikimate dehydrogenase [Tenacibaculum finnmarkense genomovar finnmarkense]MCG8212480.1 shikimate dehydrogenase [Tenacibaculum finnmarkense genomovar finnmarkense]
MEEKEVKKMYALVGKNISYSFSKGYFTNKFKELGLETSEYVNFDIQSIEELSAKIKENKTTLKGMNVTIPYKLDVFNFLDEIDKKARKIGAVNTIKISKKGKLIGFNTDVYGFKKSLKPLLKNHHKKALILGTGGASKAVAYVLKKLGITYYFVSRNPKGKKEVSYQSLSKEIIETHHLIINCTPLGTHPNIKDCPDIPYQFIGKKHLLFDLIYNPEITTFLNKGQEKNAAIKNGLEMLEQQAEKAWRIWNNS